MRIVANRELDRFREECRGWLADNVPREKRPLEGPSMREYDLAWQRHQYDAGWAGIAWPKEFGGRGASVLELLVWYEEYARANAPGRVGHIGSMAPYSNPTRSVTEPWMMLAVMKAPRWKCRISSIDGFTQLPTPAPPSRFTTYQML